MARRNQEFQTIRSEGGLLPADLLRRVLDRASNLAGTRPEDYGLPAGERLNEVITQSWNRLRKHWAEFRANAANLPENEAGTGLTNDRWNLPLLRELGFGLLPATAGPEIDGRTYAISRFFGPVPVHLIGCGLSLDRRAAGQRGAAAANPHGLVQEFLNRSDAHLWALLSNGLRLRVLRDNQALSRQSFLEFDLDAMMDGEVYSDFVLLWLVAHATRFAPREGDRPETCWLEQWTQEAEEQGTRALGELRRGVEQALTILGEGFTSHPKNTVLRDALRSGELSPTGFHAQLLRLVYRLIFLFVAEDRTLEGQQLIHPLDDSDAAHTARERYGAHYSTTRLREMAGMIKGGRHGDLWGQFQILVRALSGDADAVTVREALALPALGSFLWDPASTSDLNDAELTNFDLLDALRHLAYTRQGKVLRPVDYKNLGAEELGGVYESLLALTPQVSGGGARFSFADFAGNERKTSGSYYTPDSLVQCLLDSALDPMVEAAIKGKPPAEAEQAILALKVCDPAVGSGHFLVGAAHRLARHLARVRALAEGESEPSPLLYQHALRDIIGRCLYGVDVNPMAAELCRVSLWLEALEPGKPLTFLDHHIRVGNSLLGTTPELIADGLPDDAFKPIEGDEKKICTGLKKRNRKERDGKQMDLGLPMVAEARAEYDTLASRSQGIDRAPDDSLEAIERKAGQFRRLVVSPEYRHQQRIADAWCAAFVWPKAADAPTAITSDTIRRLEEDADALEATQREALERLATQYQFFHWHLAFPEVVARGGFDCVLGNPPWEQIEFDPKQYFSAKFPEIANAKHKAERDRLVSALRHADPFEYSAYIMAIRHVEAVKHFMHSSDCFPLTSVGRLNYAPLFAELAKLIIKSSGRSGLVLPTGILTDSYNQEFAKALLKQNQLVSMFDFENRQQIFRNVQGNMKFCLITFGANQEGAILAGCQLDDPALLGSKERTYELKSDDIRVINPNTESFPMFFSGSDAVVMLAIYRRNPIIWNEVVDDGNYWLGKSLIMFMSNSSSGLFRAKEELEQEGCVLKGNRFDCEKAEAVPFYEAKLIGQFNHRAATYDGIGQERRFKVHAATNRLTNDQLSDPNCSVLPRYWIFGDAFEASAGIEYEYYLGYRKIISAVADARSMIASIIPQSAVSDSFPLFLSQNETYVIACLCGSLNSFIVDYSLRQKASGANLNLYIFKQLPSPYPSNYYGMCSWAGSGRKLYQWLLPRLVELIYTSWDLKPFAEDCGWSGAPFRWDEQRRFLIRCELDAAFFHLYLSADENGDWRPALKDDGCPYDETPEQLEELKRHFPTPRNAVGYIMDTFPIVRRKDEEAYAEYRTRRVILEIYDAMQEAIRTGQPYRTRLDPPPGPDVDADGNFVSYADMADNQPPHIHLPRDAAPGGNVVLHLSDLATHFPNGPFLLRLNAGADAREVRARPTPTSEVEAADMVVLASPKLQRQGAAVPAAVGRLRVESRTDANDGSTYVLVSVRGDDGLAQARFAQDEWSALTTIGVVADSAAAEAADG